MSEAVGQSPESSVSHLATAARIARRVGLGLEVQVTVQHELGVIQRAQAIAREFRVDVRSDRIDDRTIRLVYSSAREGIPSDREGIR